MAWATKRAHDETNKSNRNRIYSLEIVTFNFQFQINIALVDIKDEVECVEVVRSNSHWSGKLALDMQGHNWDGQSPSLRNKKQQLFEIPINARLLYNWKRSLTPIHVYIPECGVQQHVKATTLLEALNPELEFFTICTIWVSPL